MSMISPAIGRKRPPQTTAVDLSGQRFGRLVAQSYVSPSAAGGIWLCACDCGGSAKTTITKLRSGHTQSCGCRKRELTLARTVTHGMSYSSEHGIWLAMTQRCTNPNNAAYADYAGRGIFICDRWVSGDGSRSGFECFFSDMGKRPSAAHTLDRIDNDGPYHPKNCRWATRKQQARNRRSNRMVSVDGTQMSVAEACEKLRLDHSFINARLQHGFSWERAISQPKRAW